MLNQRSLNLFANGKMLHFDHVYTYLLKSVKINRASVTKLENRQKFFPVSVKDNLGLFIYQAEKVFLELYITVTSSTYTWRRARS